MGRRHHYRRRSKEPADLDMTTFLNLMVVLVPFLLITAVFSRITILELSLPTAAGGAAPIEASMRVEVIVRHNGLEVSNGRSVIASLPMLEGEYDLVRLSDLVVSLKRSNPDKNDATVLLEPDIEYDHLIQVMDVVRSAPRPSPSPSPNELEPGSEAEEQRRQQPMHQSMQLALFTDISIGDAP
jgi:biopolymer transport protein ExbD